MNREIIVAGFGGQGILFAGKFLVYGGMLGGQEVSWLPSYGPEMRGGTANCSVILSDIPVGSPIVTHPEILIVLNQPSLEKFEASVRPGGTIFTDSTLVQTPKRSDVTVIEIPATKQAEEEGLKGLANMIMIGRVIRELNLFSAEVTEQALLKSVSARKQDMVEANRKALAL